MLKHRNSLSLIKLVSIIMTSVVSITVLAQKAGRTTQKLTPSAIQPKKLNDSNNQNPDFKREQDLKILSSPSAPRLEKLKALDQIRQYQINIKAQGGGVDGGSFSYQYTSDLHFKYYKKFLATVIKDASADFLNQFLNDFKKDFPAYKDLSIDWQEFANVIANIYPLRNIDMIQVDNEGEPRPIQLTYDQNKKQVYALREWFKKYDHRITDMEEAAEIRASLIHEVSHIFGIGINTDDSVSKFFAEKLTKLLNTTYEYRCVAKSDGGWFSDKIICRDILPSPQKKVDLSTLYYKLKTLDEYGQELTSIGSTKYDESRSGSILFVNKVREKYLEIDDPSQGGPILTKSEGDNYFLKNFATSYFPFPKYIYPLSYASLESTYENPGSLSVHISFTEKSAFFGGTPYIPKKIQPLILELYDKNGLLFRVENFKKYHERQKNTMTESELNEPSGFRKYTYSFNFLIVKDRMDFRWTYLDRHFWILE